VPPDARQQRHRAVARAEEKPGSAPPGTKASKIKY